MGKVRAGGCGEVGSVNKIKLKGILPKTADWVYFDENDDLVIEHYDFSEDAQNSFGRDVAFLIKVPQSRLRKLVQRLNKKKYFWNPFENRFLTRDQPQAKVQILELLAEKFSDYYGIQTWLLNEKIKFIKSFDDWA
jgi:hypothetical protein